MVAEADVKIANESGQSAIELLLFIPFFLGFTLILIQIATAIQISIVNQKYSRGQALLLAFNHAYYPARLNFEGSAPGLAVTQLQKIGFNRMVIGVSSETVRDEGEGLQVKATTQWVRRSRATSLGPGESKEEPEKRSLVRVRTTVTLCTPSHVVLSGSTVVPYEAAHLGFSSSFSPTSLAYCRSPSNE